MSSPRSKFLAFVAGALAALALATTVSAQFVGSGPPGYDTPQPAGGTGTTFDPTRFGTVLVYLQTEDGKALPPKANPVVRIRFSGSGAPLDNIPQWTGQGWLFSGIGINEKYDVMVSAPGYVPALQQVTMPKNVGAGQIVIVFMHPPDQELAFRPPSGRFVLAPKAEKEIQHALQDLRADRVESAQKHAGKAVQISPDNPYCQYVMGLTYVLTNHMKEAKPYLEKSVSIDSNEAPALTALGTVRYRLGDSAGAAVVLSKAVQVDPTSWKAEWLLAASYANEKKFQDALDHANQALKIGKRRAAQVQLVLGVAYAGLGKREEAAKAFDTFASDFPNDPKASEAVKWAKLMRTPVTDTSLPGTARLAILPEPPIEIPPRPDWAPPDIDAAKPFVVSGATCPLQQILDDAGKNAEELVTTLQQFSATEDFQEIEIKRGGELERPADHEFKYLVFVNQVSGHAFDVKEFRTQGSEQVRLPGRVEDTGVAAMALAFHPIIQPDLDWKCEGLGTWANQPAWVLRFEQKPKAPNVLSWFSGPRHSYGLPLKGRAWVSEGSNQVLHLETDLVKEIVPIDLKREHFSIDYEPVSFSEHNVQLWLPQNVDTYIQFEGHFLHYYHHFSDFKLFWVGTTQKISAPKEEVKRDKQQQDQDQNQK